MKNFKLILGIIIGIFMSCSAIYGVQQYREYKKKWNLIPQQYQLTQAQTEAIKSTVDTYLKLVKEEDWKQAQSMAPIYQHGLEQLQADWKSFGAISKFRFRECHAMYYPMDPNRIQATASYAVSFKSGRIEFSQFDFKLEEREGKWKIVSAHRIRKNG